MAMIDRAVAASCGRSSRLGLFEKPYVDPDRAVRVVHTAENQELALRAARESIVLLKNDRNGLFR